MRKTQGLASALLAVLLLVACAPQPAPALRPPSPAPAAAKAEAPTAAALAPSKATWEGEWEEFVAAAKKEGTIVLYSGQGRDVVIAISKRFQEKFGIRVESVTARTGQLATKTLAERRAGLHLADILMGGASTLITSLKPAGVFDPAGPALILPEVKDTKMWWEGKLPFAEKDGLLLNVLSGPDPTVAFNTELMKREEVNSYRDLLNSKWKGKILTDDPLVAGSATNTFAFLLYNLGEDFLRQFVKQEPLILRDADLMGSWVARGKYPVALALNTNSLMKYKNLGLPIEGTVPKEGAYLGTAASTVGLANGAQHPNVARLFINWILTKEAGTIVSINAGTESNRLDVPTEHLAPYSRKQPGVKYLSTWDADYMVDQPRVVTLAKEIFAPLMK